MIKINNVRIYQAMIDLGLGVRETCLQSKVNHKTLKKMLAGLMVRMDAVSRLAQTLGIPVAELLIVSDDAPLVHTDQAHHRHDTDTTDFSVNKNGKQGRIREALRKLPKIERWSKIFFGRSRFIVDC